MLEDTPAPNRRQQILLGTIGALAVLAIAFALIRNWTKIADYQWHLSPAWIAAGCAIVLLSYLANGLTYARSVEWLSPDHPPRNAAVSIWARSLLARYIPGNVMMLIGRAVMAREWGVPKRVTLAATVYEQILGLGMSAIAAAGFFALYGNPGDSRLVWVLLAVPLILVALHPRVFRVLSARALRVIKRPPLDTQFGERQVMKLLGYYAVGATLMCIGVWALVRAAAGPDIGSPLEVGLAFLLAFAISFIAFIFPSGIGVRDGILALVFSRHLPGGAAGPALAVAIGLRFALIVIELVFVGVATVVGRRR